MSKLERNQWSSLSGEKIVNFIGRDCMNMLPESLNKRKGTDFATPSSPGP